MRPLCQLGKEFEESLVYKINQNISFFQALLDEMHSLAPQLEQTLKRGKTVSEHAPKPERKQIDVKNNELRDRWRELERAVSETKRQAEEVRGFW